MKTDKREINLGWKNKIIISVLLLTFINSSVWKQFICGKFRPVFLLLKLYLNSPFNGTHSMEQNRTEHFSIFKFNAPFILHLTKTCVHSPRQCPPPCVWSPFWLPQLFLVRFLCSEAAPISGFVRVFRFVCVPTFF